MSDLLVEVDEALKQERLEKLWQKYGGFLIGFLVVVILGTAANEGYKSWKVRQNTKQTNIYLDAIEDKQATYETILKEADKITNSGLKDLARLHAAGLAIENNDIKAAIAIYKDISTNNNSYIVATYIAKYMITNLDNSLSAEEKRKRYKALSDDINNPWRFHARFEMALLDAHEFQDYKSARANLSIIMKEETLAQTLKQKAKSLDILYAAKEYSKNKMSNKPL